MKIEIQNNLYIENTYIDSVKILYPEIFNDHFKLISIKKDRGILNLYFKEINNFPKEFVSKHLKSQGFFPEITIEEFEIRGQTIYLNIKRRRWINIKTNNEGFINWNLLKSEKQDMNDFELFFKEIKHSKNLFNIS